MRRENHSTQPYTFSALIPCNASPVNPTRLDVAAFTSLAVPRNAAVNRVVAGPAMRMTHTPITPAQPSCTTMLYPAINS